MADVLRNKYHGCIVEQVLTDDGWDVSLYKVQPDGSEKFIQKCESLAEAISEAKKQGTVLPPVNHPQTGTSPEAVAEDTDGSIKPIEGITVEVEVEK